MIKSRLMLLVGAVSTLACLNMLGTVASASTQQSVTIGYTPSAIVDPSNPSTPNWSIEIPAAFEFTDTNTTRNMNVSLNTLLGDGISTNTATVSVSSTNGFKLQNAAQQNIEYTLVYGNTFNSSQSNKNNAGQNYEIGTLSKSAPELTGTATIKLPNDKKNLAGKYTDSLTYSIKVNTSLPGH